MVIASQPYRLRAPLEFKAQKVVAPLVRALGKGGRLLGIHSHGQDPGLEIIQKVWPGENPYTPSRHDILRATKAELGKDSRRYNFNAYADARALFRYEMHTLPSEISASIGTSTLFAAWNAAIYVAQIDDPRLSEVLRRQPATSTPRAKCCKSMAASGSWTNPMSSPASAIEQRPAAAVPRRASRELLIGGCSPARSSCRARCTAPPRSRALLPTDTCVYIPSLPGLPLARTLEAVGHPRARASIRCRTCRRGASLARRIRERFLKQAVREHGVHRVLLLGGDEPKPTGPVRRQPADPESGPPARLPASARSASPGYPEGHPRIPPDGRCAALRRKLKLTRRAGPGHLRRHPVLLRAGPRGRVLRAARAHRAAGRRSTSASPARPTRSRSRATRSAAA